VRCPLFGRREPRAGWSDEEVIGLDVGHRQPQGLQPLLGVEQRVPETQVELLRVLGSLEVPEQGEEAVVRLGRGQMLELLEQRGFSEPPSAECPESVARSLENLRD
jgi:hypothetical protein